MKGSTARYIELGGVEGRRRRMNEVARPITILVADDDEDDRLLMSEMLEESRLHNELRFVEDGEELLEYLKGEGRYAERGSAPRPGVILLDLNMPKMDGREALAEIKNDADLKGIPVFVLTTSTMEDDVHNTYELGGSSFLAKPVTFDSLVEAVATLTRYRFAIVDPCED